MKRMKTPIHDFWHPRVEGQIRDAMNAHPDWFAQKHKTVVRSIAKRIVGEIAAACGVVAMPDGVDKACASPAGAGGGVQFTAARREGGGAHTAALPKPECGWIDVKDRLPEAPKGATKPMLVVYQPKTGNRDVTTAFYTGKGWKFRPGKTRLSERVTHWMPMPKAPGKR